MVRYKATISYDGTLFSGFQRQPNARSIQEELEKTLLRLNSGTPVTVHGAGRTDAGVHAYGQVIHFDLPQERDPEKLRFGLDTQCPDDIDVVLHSTNGALNKSISISACLNILWNVSKYSSSIRLL